MIWFVQLAKKYHPDHNKDEQASAKFTEIGEAYEVNLLLYMVDFIIMIIGVE